METILFSTLKEFLAGAGFMLLVYGAYLVARTVWDWFISWPFEQ